MRIWISGGGTAGHIYPALTVLDAGGPEAGDVLWLGTLHGPEARIVGARGLAFQAISAAPVVGSGALRLPLNLLRLLRGTLQAWRLMADRPPDIVLVTGGYVSVPVAIATWLRRRPLSIYLPDIRPGRAIRLLAPLADTILVTAEAAGTHLPAGKVRVTGYPVRPAIRAANAALGRARFGLSGERPVVLVFGGSQGARRINDATVAAAAEILKVADIVHLTGVRGHAMVQAAAQHLPPDLVKHYQAHAYLDSQDMAAAMAAADLAVCRAGAAILGELPARGLPAILVPLAIAHGHQAANAAVLVDCGAAVMIEDAALSAGSLQEAVTALIADPTRRAAMATAARSLDRPEAAATIWRTLTERARKASPGGRRSVGGGESP